MKIHSPRIYTPSNLLPPVITHSKKKWFQKYFDKELRKYIPQDSITGFIDGYLDATEGYFDKYESDGIQQQQAMFNYSEQQRAREKAEKSNKWLWILVGIVALGLLLVLLIVSFFYTSIKSLSSICLKW